jgi:hypothetical protein
MARPEGLLRRPPSCPAAPHTSALDGLIEISSIVDFAKVTGMDRQEGRGSLNTRLEHLRPGRLTQVGNDGTGVETMGSHYLFHRRSSMAFSSCLCRAKTALLVRVSRRDPIVRAMTAWRCSTAHGEWA